MPLNPLTTSALITGGSSILGGMLGGGDTGPGKTAQLRSYKLAKDQFEYQKTLNKNQIQYKVADAKAAGLHPLYALGSSANFSPTSYTPTGQSETGSALGRGIAEAGRQVGNLVGQQGLIQSQIGANDAAAERDYAASALALSNMKRAEDEANSRQDFDINVEPDFKKQPVPKIPTRKLESGTQKGTQPFFTEYDLGSGYSFYGPRAEEPAEALENVGGMLMALPKNILHIIKGVVGPYQRAAQRAWDRKYKSTGYRRGRNQ